MQRVKQNEETDKYTQNKEKDETLEKDLNDVKLSNVCETKVMVIKTPELERRINRPREVQQR